MDKMRIAAENEFIIRDDTKDCTYLPSVKF